MTHTRLAGFATIATLALSASALGAQVAQVPAQGVQPQVQLAFGYECGDRFLVRNDGAQPVDLEYGVAGGPEHSRLHLNGNASVELSSASDKSVELWVNGKLVATAIKGARPCAQAPTAPAVVVRPIGPGDYVANVDPAYVYASRVVYDPWAYGYYPYYAPFFSYGVPVYPRFGFGVVFRGRGRYR